MDVKVEDISSVKKKLTFELPADQVAAEIDKAYGKIAKSAKIPGFRPGKVPRSILERNYEPQMQREVLGKLVNDSYFRALMENQIPAVSDPDIVDSGPLEKGKPFTYEARVEVKPELEARDYTGLTLQKERFEPDPAAVDKQLEEMRSSRAEIVPAGRDEAGTGDHVVIDFEGFLDGEPFEGGKAGDYQLELGSGSFIPGFEEQVEGMKAGEEKEIRVTFPEDYGNQELAGREVVFQVRLKEVKERVVPEIDDEFAKGFGVETVEELRAKLAEHLESQERSRVESDLRERLMSQLVERNPLEVPEAMVDSQLEYMLGNVRSRMQAQGMSLEMLGMNEETFKQGYRDTAVKQVQGSLILEAIAQQEGLTVEPGEIDGKLEKIAEMSNAPLDVVKRHYANEEARRGLLAQMQEEKVIEFLLEAATVEEVEKEQLEDDQSEPEKE